MNLSDIVVSEALKTAIKYTLEKHLLPLVQKMVSKGTNELEAKYRNTHNIFEEYLLRKVSQLSAMQTLVFKNQQLTIQDVYQPLTLVSSRDRTQYKIQNNNNDFIEKFKRILIVDTAGMGKTTLMKWIFIKSIGEPHGIPIFIELRKLSKENTILKEFFNQISGFNNEFSKEYINELFTRGQFLFFFDGYDEIRAEYKGTVTTDMESFIANAPQNKYFVTSRDEKALSSFGQFQRFDIKEHKPNEAFELIKKYDVFSRLSLYESLVEQIKKSPELIEDKFLTNPLMTSLIYATFRSKMDIPRTKDQLYKLFMMHYSKITIYLRDIIKGISILNYLKHSSLR